ncbi:MAG TPA: response regulator [Euzebyales bacterium]|nr:response regulator [Euzebyales bacterium]
MTARVLIVDDTAMNRQVLARAVTTLGYEAVTAGDGSQALDRLRATPDAGGIDVVLLDLLMPVLDGFATLQQIKDDAELEHLPVIMVSAVDDIDSVIRCIELGATDYLSKPVHGPLLRARLQASLAAKRLRDVELDHLAQVDRVVQAAVGIETGSYDGLDSLDAVAGREDALGTLARVFERMAREVAAREEALRRQVAELQIEIDHGRRRRQVAEVTGSDYYRRLTREAAELKRILTEGGDRADG